VPTGDPGGFDVALAELSRRVGLEVLRAAPGRRFLTRPPARAARPPAGTAPPRRVRRLPRLQRRGRRTGEPLSEEFDLIEMALAAVKLAHETSGTSHEQEEFPEAEMPSADDRRGRRNAPGRNVSGRDTGGRGQRRGRPPGAGTTRPFVGTGHSSGVRPQDLVGAITGESYLSGSDIGAIEIADRFSLVEVPESAADDVVTALRQASIKGRRTTVRRERYPAR
jgi:ATP-dependent RNA helicase DeaD